MQQLLWDTSDNWNECQAEKECSDSKLIQTWQTCFIERGKVKSDYFRILLLLDETITKSKSDILKTLPFLNERSAFKMAVDELEMKSVSIQPEEFHRAFVVDLRRAQKARVINDVDPKLLFSLKSFGILDASMDDIRAICSKLKEVDNDRGFLSMEDKDRLRSGTAWLSERIFNWFQYDCRVH